MLSKISCYIIVLGFTLISMSCKFNNSSKQPKVPDSNAVISLLADRYQKMIAYPIDSLGIPRSASLVSEKVRKTGSGDWTSGFFPGNLWQLYRITGDNRYKKRAEDWNAFIEKEKRNTSTHDVGFMVFCSFGNAIKVTGSKKYEDIVVKSAQTLSRRFNKNVGSIRSWDFNKEEWEYPVIIDNMMNLELLFEATRISGDSVYHDLAIKHANTTLKNHFRIDNSTYHVVVYDTISGAAKNKITHQGYSDQSSWARGQAWAVYGYTMAYRYTKNRQYLKQAEATAMFFIKNETLPTDGVPYWDFNDPSIPDAPRDVSAATIIASALIELYTNTRNKTYLDYADKVLQVLQSEEYLLDRTVTAPFILNHSTGNLPNNSEIDEPIVYADYYFLEAMLRKKALKL